MLYRTFALFNHYRCRILVNFRLTSLFEGYRRDNVKIKSYAESR